ncbi:hypothetical protein CEXT_438871 [Caerostris extrusa]|uniref:Uncharacterized protein n=1 Tax=Caerostris extrusa TaxID=172846 RepID=A0AAV4VEH7_CAEEX|nr:hypothetical protein CEXT_438871 [Caerostris extrusa]
MPSHITATPSIDQCRRRRTNERREQNRTLINFANERPRTTNQSLQGPRGISGHRRKVLAHKVISEVPVIQSGDGE